MVAAGENKKRDEQGEGRYLRRMPEATKIPPALTPEQCDTVRKGVKVLRRQVRGTRDRLRDTSKWPHSDYGHQSLYEADRPEAMADIIESLLPPEGA